MINSTCSLPYPTLRILENLSGVRYHVKIDLLFRWLLGFLGRGPVGRNPVQLLSSGYMRFWSILFCLQRICFGCNKGGGRGNLSAQFCLSQLWQALEKRPPPKILSNACWRKRWRNLRQHIISCPHWKFANEYFEAPWDVRTIFRLWNVLAATIAGIRRYWHATCIILYRRRHFTRWPRFRVSPEESVGFEI